MTTQVVRLFLSSVLVLGLGVAAHTQEPQHQHQQTPAKPSADMSAQCKAMMAQHEKMEAQTKAGDQRLDDEGAAGAAAREAEARLQIGKDLEVGYGGFYECPQ